MEIKLQYTPNVDGKGLAAEVWQRLCDYAEPTIVETGQVRQEWWTMVKEVYDMDIDGVFALTCKLYETRPIAEWQFNESGYSYTLYYRLEPSNALPSAVSEEVERWIEDSTDDLEGSLRRKGLTIKRMEL